jgi:hypothetical protein
MEFSRLSDVLRSVSFISTILVYYYCYYFNINITVNKTKVVVSRGKELVRYEALLGELNAYVCLKTGNSSDWIMIQAGVCEQVT